MRFCQGLSQFQECVCCSEIDWVAFVAKTMKRLRQKDSACLHNTTPGIPSRLLKSLGSSDGLVLMQTAVPRLLRRPNTQTNTGEVVLGHFRKSSRCPAILRCLLCWGSLSSPTKEAMKMDDFVLEGFRFADE
ncbi:unnamed protein product [Porites evermanni]|uniref:Uncharacterized protein n=1 Tax=Porites evermanni TaxID=104178 RepID=A0ABN8LSJ8_9CNID|nr:unnamed protein product [Porites evermanni]